MRSILDENWKKCKGMLFFRGVERGNGLGVKDGHLHEGWSNS